MSVPKQKFSLDPKTLINFQEPYVVSMQGANPENIERYLNETVCVMIDPSQDGMRLKFNEPF